MHIIGGKYKHRSLSSPKGDQTRPTASRLREALFNICQTYVEGADFLDLFAGSGAMGLEALSRGARSATFVDNSQEAVRCIKRNIAALKAEDDCTVLFGQVLSLLKLFERQGKVYDLIYVDPPYNTSIEIAGEIYLYSESIIHQIDKSSLLISGGTLFVEEDARHPPKIATDHLILKDSRKFGHSLLQRYEKP